MKDACEKIYKVLESIRVKFLDIPTICTYRQYEYKPELNEEAVWLVYNFDIEYGFGGAVVDWSEHVAHEFTRVSLWGHDFSVSQQVLADKKD